MVDQDRDRKNQDQPVPQGHGEGESEIVDAGTSHEEGDPQEPEGPPGDGHGDQDSHWRGDDHPGTNYEGQAYERERVIERIVEKDQADNTLGTIALVTGIVGIVLFFCCFGVDFILGIVALVTGILGHREGQKYALAGLVMGAVVIVLNLLFMMVGLTFTFFEPLF